MSCIVGNTTPLHMTTRFRFNVENASCSPFFFMAALSIA